MCGINIYNIIDNKPIIEYTKTREETSNTNFKAKLTNTHIITSNTNLYTCCNCQKFKK